MIKTYINYILFVNILFVNILFVNILFVNILFVNIIGKVLTFFYFFFTSEKKLKCLLWLYRKHTNNYESATSKSKKQEYQSNNGIAQHWIHVLGRLWTKSPEHVQQAVIVLDR